MIKIKNKRKLIRNILIIILIILLIYIFYNKINALIYLNKNDININEELIENETLLGLTDITGEGIILNIEDGNDLIHQEDLIILLDELKNAGSEAISVNDVRIVNSSYIYCDGTVILLDGIKISNPFIIKAIGNSEVLYTALSRNKGYVQTLTDDGIKINIEKNKNINILKTSKIVSEKYKNTNSRLEKLTVSNEIIGKSDCFGAGITIKITTTENKDISALKLIQLINDLNCAGAKAISIDNNRIVNMSDAMDINKQYILVDSNIVSSPYIIKAIGNISDLKTSINLENSTISKLVSSGFDVKIYSNLFMKIDNYNTNSRGQNKLLLDYIKR